MSYDRAVPSAGTFHAWVLDGEISGTGFDAATAKFDADGNLVWADVYNNPAVNSWDGTRSLALY
ncbi:MAG: hypothetical protein ABII00_12950 [Elusimicrobiota bacterium]